MPILFKYICAKKSNEIISAHVYYSPTCRWGLSETYLKTDIYLVEMLIIYDQTLSNKT